MGADACQQLGRRARLGVPETVDQPQLAGLAGCGVQRLRVVDAEVVVVAAVHEQQRRRGDLADDVEG